MTPTTVAQPSSTVPAREQSRARYPDEEGYVERRPSPVDRRVKTVVITKAGQRARERLEGAMFEPPKELLDLPEADIKALRRITAKLPGGTDHRPR